MRKLQLPSRPSNPANHWTFAPLLAPPFCFFPPVWHSLAHFGMGTEAAAHAASHPQDIPPAFARVSLGVCGGVNLCLAWQHLRMLASEYSFGAQRLPTAPAQGAREALGASEGLQRRGGSGHLSSLCVEDATATSFLGSQGCFLGSESFTGSRGRSIAVGMLWGCSQQGCSSG